ncbi:hypothetical protein, partial [Streptomyces sp. NPDC006624]|uniref:hypothetical protein n=1 Tax=Streptomyces sp. NPDC006624 TaxID=3154892 RepID=UPI0033A80382
LSLQRVTTSQDQQLPSASGRVTFFVLPKKVTKERRFPCFRIKSHYGSALAQGCATQAIHGLGGARRASCAPPFGSLFACGEFGAAGGAKSDGNSKINMDSGFRRNDERKAAGLQVVVAKLWRLLVGSAQQHNARCRGSYNRPDRTQLHRLTPAPANR